MKRMICTHNNIRRMGLRQRKVDERNMILLKWYELSRQQTLFHTAAFFWDFIFSSQVKYPIVAKTRNTMYWKLVKTRCL